MESIWTKDIKIPEFPAVEQDMKVDVLVVGGGMCGLLDYSLSWAFLS